MLQNVDIFNIHGQYLYISRYVVQNYTPCIFLMSENFKFFRLLHSPVIFKVDFKCLHYCNYFVTFLLKIALLVDEFQNVCLQQAVYRTGYLWEFSD